MPTAGQWTKFLVSAGGFLGMGVYTVTRLMPSDEELIAKLSPELKARYYKEREIRHRAEKIMQEKIQATQDKPAWLQGAAKMREFERNVMLQARAEVEGEDRHLAEQDQRRMLKELAEKEKRM